MKAIVERIFPERAATYNRVSVEIGPYTLSVCDGWDKIIDDDEYAQKVADKLNKIIDRNYPKQKSRQSKINVE